MERGFGLRLGQKSSQNPMMVLSGFLWYCMEMIPSTTTGSMVIYGFTWLWFVVAFAPIWVVNARTALINVVPVVISSVETS